MNKRFIDFTVENNGGGERETVVVVCRFFLGLIWQHLLGRNMDDRMMFNL